MCLTNAGWVGMSSRNQTSILTARGPQCEQCRSSLSTAAHELKTPLTVLGGYVELLLSEKAGPLTPKQREIMLEMRRYRAQVLDHIGDFLTFSSMNLADLDMRYEEGEIEACLRELVSFWQPKYREKTIKLTFTAEPVPPFRFDYHKVQHIVSNLLENAFKYCPESSKVVIGIEPYFWERRLVDVNFPADRRARPRQEPNSVRISVADNGFGIAPEFQQEIFQEFFRLSADNEVQGSGLGLAIARRLAYAHGGKIWVESQVGAGSTFAVLLPYFPRSRNSGEDQNR